MANKCHNCPQTKAYIDMGGCPNCFTKKLLMSTQTHMATCDKCGTTFGIPIAIEGICYDDECYKRYTVSIDTKLNTQQLLVFSKLIRMNGAQTYQLFKSNMPVILENISMVSTYQIRAFFRSQNIPISIQPEIDEYPLFEKCWNIQQR